MFVYAVMSGCEGGRSLSVFHCTCYNVYNLDYTNTVYNSDPHIAYSPDFKRLLCTNTSKDLVSDSHGTQQAPCAAMSA
jgi:hypothetical protein